MSQPTADKESVMSKITKLLERANHPDTPPHEAQLCEDMAEKLMAKNMIDRFEAEQAAKRRGESVLKPVSSTWEFVSSHKGDDGSGYEFDSQVHRLMETVLKHCNVRLNPNYSHPTKVVGEDFGIQRRATDYSRKIYKIVGYPADIAYAERIWFNVFRTFVSNINPVWDKNKSIEWNAYNFASAGVMWKQQVLLAEKAGDDRIEWPLRYQKEDKNKPFFSSFNAGAVIDPGNEPWGRSIHKLKRACKKYSEDHGLPYPYAAGTKLRMASRNNFAQSYSSTIEDRLAAMRIKAKASSDNEQHGKFALALQDTAEQVDAEFYRLFPEYSPEARRKRQEDAEWLRAAQWAALSPDEQMRILREEAKEEEKWQRRQERARDNYRKVRHDPSRRFDAAAWERGMRAGQSVNLRDDAEVKKETRKGIE